MAYSEINERANVNFKPIGFDRFKAESGDNAFTLTPQQWIKAMGAIGIISKSGRYGGTYAHTDIAFLVLENQGEYPKVSVNLQSDVR